MSGADVAGLISAINSRDNDSFFGDGIWGIIMLLIVAGIFTGGWGVTRGEAVAAGLARADLDSEFTQRDIFNTNTNVLNNQYAIATTAMQTQKDVLDAKYADALNTQSIISSQKDCCCESKILGLQNTYELAQLAERNNFNNLLGNKDLTAAILADGEKTRAMISEQYINSLLEKVNDLKAKVNNAEQSEYLLNTMGRWHAYPSCACGYGTCQSQNLI